MGGLSPCLSPIPGWAMAGRRSAGTTARLGGGLDGVWLVVAVAALLLNSFLQLEKQLRFPTGENSDWDRCRVG